MLALMEADNDKRNEAEKEYESVSLIHRMSFLLGVLATDEREPNLHQQAAILLRRCITTHFDEGYLTLSPDQQNEFKSQLLNCITINQEQFVRKKVADCVSELSRRLITGETKTNAWPEVLKFMFDTVGSSDAGLKEIPLHIFGTFPGVFGDQQEHYQQVIHQMLAQCLQQSEAINVRVAASLALVSFLQENATENPGIFRYYQDVIPGLIQTCEENALDDDTQVLKVFIELCEDAPKAVRPHLNAVLQLALKLVADQEREDSVRQLALEICVSLAETAPGMIRKQKTAIPVLVPEMLKMMCELDDDEQALQEWSVSDDTVDDTDANNVCAENAIDRFACAIGGKVMLPVVMNSVPQMLQSDDWRFRHAGLMALSAVGEGCHKHMEEMLSAIVTSITPFLKDPHPRVRYATCNALGQMCTDFAPTMQKQFHKEIIPSLYETLDDVKNPRVQAHGGAALVNFVEDCPSNVLAPYLEPLCGKVQQVLELYLNELGRVGAKLVLEQVTTTIAAIADTAADQFITYYDRFIPTLKYIMQNANGDEYRMLRGKTIECISLIGLAVGREKFMPDAQEIMGHLLRTQADTDSWEDDDPQISYMISAWARMCRLLGEKFNEYLPVVMGPLMKAASIKPEVTMLDTQDVENVDEDDGWEFIKLGDQQSFGIKTAGLEEKATACQMLVCYARELKKVFIDYVEDVVKLMVPLLKFYFHDGVRTSAAHSLAPLLEAAAQRGEDYVKNIWDFICPSLLTAIEDEPVSDLTSSMMDALARCIELRGIGCLTIEQYQQLAKILHKLLEEHFVKADERMGKRNDEDYDEQMEEQLMQEDNDDVYTLSKISDILHALFGTHKSELFPFFDSLLPHYVKLLGKERPWADRQWSLCVFDDIVEHCGADALKYSEIFVRPMVECLDDESPEVRQAASYGIGVMAMSAPEAFASVIREALPRLRQVITGPRGYMNGQRQLSQEEQAPLENCVSAVAKILKHAPVLLGDERASLLRDWLNWLPVTEDKEEATHVYGFLADLIESNDPVVLGENNVNLAGVIKLVGDAVYGHSFEECPEVATRIAAICKSVQTNAGNVWLETINSLPAPKQMALGHFLNNPLEQSENAANSVDI